MKNNPLTILLHFQNTRIYEPESLQKRDRLSNIFIIISSLKKYCFNTEFVLEK